MRQALAGFWGILFVLLMGMTSAHAQVTRAEADSMAAGPQSAPAADSASKPKVRFNKFNRPPLYSAILPGAGQFVNRQYYKIPIIYAGAGVLTYFIIMNNRNYQLFKKALTLRQDGDSGTHDRYENIYTPAQLLRARDFYRRNRDLTIIIAAAIYGLQIADAHVFAHLREFNVSDELSLRADPVIVPRYMTGLSLTLALRK